MSEDKLFFQLYNPTGMINQVMSMELAVGLAFQTKRNTIVHFMSNSGDGNFNFNKVPIYTPSRFSNEQRVNFTSQDQFPHLKDILDWPDVGISTIDEQINSFPEENVVYGNILENNYYSPHTETSTIELEFAEGRQKLKFTEGVNYHLKFTLGWYSRFFFDRSPELDRILSEVKFKKEYYDFADLVLSYVGKFQGAHLRLSDHVRMFNTTEEMFESGLSKLEKNNLPILLCTDEPLHPMVVKNKDRFTLLDEVIVNNFESEFKSLPFNDEVVFGLVCNLIMHKAEHFIGTSGSTYTGYIHRKRHQEGFLDWDFFDEPEANNIGPFSWSNYMIDVNKKMWWREWPESKLYF